MFSVLQDSEDSDRLRSIMQCLPASPRLIVDIGCGECSDATIYREVAGQNAVLIGIDCDWQALIVARRRLDRAGGIGVLADIRDLPARGNVDWLLMRHPDIDRHQPSWRRFIQSAPTLLAPGGALLCTTYSIFEAERLANWLRADPRLSEHIAWENHFAPVSLSGRDRFVLIYRRSEDEIIP